MLHEQPTIVTEVKRKVHGQNRQRGGRLTEARALPRVSPVCEEADGVCAEEFAEAATGTPVVRDDRTSATAGAGEVP